MKTDKKKADLQIPVEYTKDSIQIFPTNDDRLKFLGEIFSNESSRKILTLFLEKEVTIMKISKESEISPNLIIHHLKKMIESNIVTITKESTNSRGRPLRFYRAKSAIIILSKDAVDRANASKSLKKTLGKITRFASIGLAGMFTWIFTTSSYDALDSASKYPRPTLSPYMSPVEPRVGDGFFPILLVVGIVVVGIVINHYLPKIRK